ncbi:MAG: MFS transporter [Chloroflexi bacterium]|nr:MFS transporter [Chloroflexota bacterium]
MHEFRPFHARVTALAGLAFLGNGLDLSVVSFALNGMRAEWELTATQVGFVLPMAGLGQLAGAIAFGSLSDRIGRRLAFAITSTLAGLAIGLAALAPNPVVLALLVLLGGLGIGGVAPAAGALLSEFAPPAYRGRMMAWTQVFWVIGWSIAATAGGWFEQSLGWRGILGVGALPMVLGYVSWLLIPESPRFLLARGRTAEAEALAAQLAERYGITIPLVAPATGSRRMSLLAQVAALWSPTYRRRTFALWTTWMAMNTVFAGPINWMPVLLAGVGAENPLRLSALVGYAMLPGAFVSVVTIDRSGRRPLMMLSLAVAGFGAAIAALGRDPLWLVLGGCALSAGALAAWPVALAWSSEQYPTNLRGTAAGWAAAASRIGSVSAPIAIGVLITASSGEHLAALAPFAVLLFGAVVSVAMFASETANRTLEELTAQPPKATAPEARSGY